MPEDRGDRLLRPRLEVPDLGRELRDPPAAWIPPQVITGGTVQAGINIHQWTPDNVARQPDPERWTHVSCHLFCEVEPLRFLDQHPTRTPHLQHPILADGQRFEWTFKLPLQWGVGRDVKLVLFFCDEHGTPPQYGESLQRAIIVLPAP